MTRLARTHAEIDASRGAGPVAFVPTMGALHAGHAALVEEARRRVGARGTVLTSVFVNPTQFGAGEDFSRYPRTLDADVELAASAGADVVFAPSALEVYGEAEGFRADSVTVDPGPVGAILEGAARPGHFTGVLTVVLKLFGLTRPDLALFGEKDYQQLMLVSRMARDLSLGVEIVGVPTVRDADGLALSSRNRYLSDDERATALVLPRALHAVAQACAGGAEAGLAAGRAVLAQAAGVVVDYLTVTAPDLGPAPDRGAARALVAAGVGSTRLIDNLPCHVGPS